MKDWENLMEDLGELLAKGIKQMNWSGELIAVGWLPKHTNCRCTWFSPPHCPNFKARQLRRKWMLRNLGRAE